MKPNWRSISVLAMALAGCMPSKPVPFQLEIVTDQNGSLHCEYNQELPSYETEWHGNLGSDSTVTFTGRFSPKHSSSPVNVQLTFHLTNTVLTVTGTSASPLDYRIKFVDVTNEVGSTIHVGPGSQVIRFTGTFVDADRPRSFR